MLSLKPVKEQVTWSWGSRARPTPHQRSQLYRDAKEFNLHDFPCFYVKAKSEDEAIEKLKQTSDFTGYDVSDIPHFEAVAVATNVAKMSNRRKSDKPILYCKKLGKRLPWHEAHIYVACTHSQMDDNLSVIEKAYIEKNKVVKFVPSKNSLQYLDANPNIISFEEIKEKSQEWIYKITDVVDSKSKEHIKFLKFISLSRYSELIMNNRAISDVQYLKNEVVDIRKEYYKNLSILNEFELDYFGDDFKELYEKKIKSNSKLNMYKKRLTGVIIKAKKLSLFSNLISFDELKENMHTKEAQLLISLLAQQGIAL